MYNFLLINIYYYYYNINLKPSRRYKNTDILNNKL